MLKNSLLVGLLFVILWSACSSDSPSSKEPIKGLEVNGRSIYKKYCTVCHGIKGNMGLNGAHDLTLSKMVLDERIKMITEGKNVMTPFKGTLTKKEIDLVAQFTMTLNHKGE